MNLLHAYCEGLKEGDAKKIALLFTKDAIFNDYAPTKYGQKPIILKGRNNIETFFKEIFTRGGLKTSNISINGNAVRYDIEVGGIVFLALGVMKTEDNLIKEYKVTSV